MLHIIYECNYEEMVQSFAKRIVRSLAKWAQFADICNTLIESWHTDQLTEDIVASVNLAIWECISENLESVTCASYIQTKKQYLILSEDAYKHCSSAVQSVIVSAKGIRGQLFVDDFEGDYNENDGAIISAKDKTAYINALEKHMSQRSKDAVLARIKYFLNWVDEESRRSEDTKRMLKAVAVLLASGYSIDGKDGGNAITDALGISATRAYYYVKALKEIHEKHNPIERKVFTYIKLEGNDYYTKVQEDEAIEVCEDKKRKIKAFFLNGERVFPATGTRARRYVINKSVLAFREADYITTYKGVENASPCFLGLPAVRRSDADISLTDYNPFTVQTDNTHRYKNGYVPFGADRSAPMKHHPISVFSEYDIANSRKPYRCDIGKATMPEKATHQAIAIPHTIRRYPNLSNLFQILD